MKTGEGPQAPCRCRRCGAGARRRRIVTGISGIRGLNIQGRPYTIVAVRVLIADDNVDSADSLGLLLNLLGVEVRVAHDGLEAIAVGREYRPNVVLLDIAMPRLNGHEAARQIRQEEWGRQAKLVAITGWSDDRHKEQTRAAGFDDHLVKPVALDDLKKLLA